MDKNEFNQLPVEKQVKYFNNLLRQGYSINKACKDAIGIAKSTVTDRFKAHGYIRIDNQYVKGKDVKHANNIVVNEIAVDKDMIKTNCSEPTNINKHKNNIDVKEESTVELLQQDKDIIELINIKDKLKEVIEWHEQYRDILVIDPKPINEGEGVTRSFKCDSKILQQFIQFCETHSQYSQKDLLSWSLYLMMKGFNK